MLYRSPCEVYTKYLILSGHDNQAIKNILVSYGLDWLSNEYVDRLRVGLSDRPEVFRPRDRAHEPTLQFLVRHGVYDIFFPDRDTSLAFDFIERPSVKVAIEASLINMMPYEAVASSVQSLLKFHATPTAVRRYAQFFWDLSLVDVSGVKLLLLERGKNVPKSVVYTDPRWVAAHMPKTPTGAMLTQMRMGLAPTRIDTAMLLRRSIELIALRMNEALETGTLGSDQVTNNLSNSLRMLQEISQAMSKPEEGLASQLSKVAVRTETSTVPMIESVTGGNHTTELVAEVSKVKK